MACSSDGRMWGCRRFQRAQNEQGGWGMCARGAMTGALYSAHVQCKCSMLAPQGREAPFTFRNTRHWFILHHQVTNMLRYDGMVCPCADASLDCTRAKVDNGQCAHCYSPVVGPHHPCHRLLSSQYGCWPWLQGQQQGAAYAKGQLALMSSRSRTVERSRNE
jgi:hypothetical protein